MKNKKIFLISLVILIILVSFVIFRNLHLGVKNLIMVYDYVNGSQTIELGVPKFSFDMKENDKSYSFKNLRSARAVNDDIKSFLETLEPIECRNATYYYDRENDFTIVDYSAKNRYVYSSISYRVVDGNYCFERKVQEYANLLGGIKLYHSLNGEEISLTSDKKFDSRLVVMFLDNVDLKNQTFTATMSVEYLVPILDDWKHINRRKIEQSSGTYEIKDNKLYYTRTETTTHSDDVKILEVSVFEIKDEKLTLISDNYLANYEKEIILK